MTATLAAPSALSAFATFRPSGRSGGMPPLSVPAGDYHRHVAAGAVAVDIRSQAVRERDGVVFGAVAVPADAVLDRLTPGGPDALRIAAPGARWLLISDDGHDAEWLAWHLQARGVLGARFVVGGHRRMCSERINGSVSPAELAMISAH
ncbi:rhodanese-like domain-containing protein [Gordonia sp. TBRC 11910]|uniref:Rhodanese-like domain-containing protein n=1 Tax=Gordonia asplenii TaxID=2725283 RepID=A0A848L7S1_9ACTN|nr:rhodanese-like domain-containing protein [Gordonia asplenii]NMO04793.1 rhodanese-like domain-containing protein [Gordonia asplenii]